MKRKRRERCDKRRKKVVLSVVGRKGSILIKNEGPQTKRKHGKNKYGGREKRSAKGGKTNKYSTGVN